MYERSKLVTAALALLVALTSAGFAGAEEYSAAAFGSPNIIRKISRQSERLEMTSNSSRILTLDMDIPRVQVNNPELVAVTPLSATQIQVSAKKPGVTQINLWDKDQKIHTVDVIIYGDVRELEFALKTQFPNSTVNVKKFSQSLMLTGFVESPDHVSPIMRLAEDYAPKVINNLEVGGVQQVLLRVQLFEVSRTKLRRLGVDWAHISGSGGFVGSSVSGLLASVNGAGVTTTGGATVEFGIVSGNNEFFGFLDALQQNNIAKVLAEPNIVSVSGRPAQFLEGGEIPILVPQSLGTSSIEFKPFGTQVDFLPIVLGNGNIRLEVRPRVSDIDPSIGINLQNQNIPGFRVRQADTAVEMKAGQTFALAGLIQRRTEAVHRGLPFISDVPVLGVPFRKVEEEVNEIELLILVTPEFIDAMDPHEVPQCGPGMGTMSPDNCTLYMGGHLEVPNAYGPCGPGCDGGAAGCDGCASGGCDSCGAGVSPAGAYPTDGIPVGPEIPQPIPAGEIVPQGEAVGRGMQLNENYTPLPVDGPIHGELRMPGGPPANGGFGPNGGAQYQQSRAGSPYRQAARAPIPGTGYDMQRPGDYRRGGPQSMPPSVPTAGGSGNAVGGGLIGPVGYDVE
ncbi:MAG: type II and III secretion system protein family protein [Aeoliella sp.]